MKNKYILSMILAATVFSACEPDHRNDNLPESAVYFVANSENKGVQSALMYDIQDESVYNVYAYCSGYYGGNPNVSITSDEEFLETYNAINETTYKLLPSECWSIVKGEATMQDRKAEFSIKFNVTGILALSSEEDYSDVENYAVVLRLDSEDIPVAGDSDESLGYLIVTPDLTPATVKLTATPLDKNRQMTLTVELPFNNSWDFSYELDFGKEGAFGMNEGRGNHIPAKYICSPLPDGVTVENKSVTTMAPGTNKVEYKITFPEPAQWKKGVSHNYAFSIKNPVLNGKEIAIGEPAVVSLDPKNILMKGFATTNGSNDPEWFECKFLDYGLTIVPDYGGARSGSTGEIIKDEKGFIFHPQSSQQFYYDRVFNDVTWASQWDASWGSGYGNSSVSALPMWILIDMRTPKKINGIEWWRRHEGKDRTSDVRTVEFYALDKCQYTLQQPVLDYATEDITYLGTLDFGDASNLENVAYTTFDFVETQYIMLYVTAGNRGKAVDIMELSIWGN